MTRFLFLYFLFISLYSDMLMAQDVVVNEVQRMQQAARQAMVRNDFEGAQRLLYQIAIKEPHNVVARRDLAYTHYVLGETQKAKELINPILQSEKTDAEVYRIASAIEAKLGNNRKARKILEDGIIKYPQSGALYYSLGLMENSKKSLSINAIKYWESGINNDPNYAPNYFYAAQAHAAQKSFVKAILLAEIFVNLDPFSTRSIEMKTLIWDAYNKVFTPTKDALPSFKPDNNSGLNVNNTTLEDTYKYLINKSSSLLVKEIDIEMITMLRTRIILDWYHDFKIHYPYSLFEHHHKLLNNGHFTAYNYWLLGASSDSYSFNQWLTVHSGSYKEFEQWFNDNPLTLNLHESKF